MDLYQGSYNIGDPAVNKNYQLPFSGSKEISEKSIKALTHRLLDLEVLELPDQPL